MEAKELMIGDWVECVDSTHKEKVYAQIDAIEEGQTCILVRLDNCNWFLDISFIKPIPLTREILEKNGFVNDDNNHDLRYYQSCGDIIGVDIRGDIGYLEDADLKYVHRLQHALCVCGVEKEIVL